MVPRMLLVCVHVTSFVFPDINGRRLSAVSFRSPGSAEGVHHLSLKLRILARRTQAEMFASWSMDEQMISASSGKDRAKAWERFEKSWVVEGPMTEESAKRILGCSEGMNTYLIEAGVHEIGSCLEALIVLLRRFLTDIVGGTELDIGLFEVRSDAVSRIMTGSEKCQILSDRGRRNGHTS